MSDMLEKGSRWLGEQMRRHASQRVVYRRASSSANIPATIGVTEFETGHADGVKLEFQVRDYLIEVRDLNLDGVPTEPAAGDQIVECVPGGDGVVYEVMPMPGGQIWSYSDLYRRTYRIHTKFAGPMPAAF